MRDVRIALAASLTVGCLLFAEPRRAEAAPVAPGATITLDGLGFTPPAGDVVATDSDTVTLSVIIDPAAPTPETFDLTLNSEVRRDPATNLLTFVYDFDETPGPTFPALTNQQRQAIFSSFASFDTDVTSDSAVSITRSADGGSITADATATGETALTLSAFVISTNATEFDSSGTVTGTLGGEFTDPLTGAVPISSPFSFADTFQPITDDGGGGGGGPGVPIPLPAGVWVGLVALAGTGTLTKFRRRLRLI